MGHKNKNRKKNSLLIQLITGKIYKDHVHGKDESFIDRFVNVKPTEYTRIHIGLFLIWIWGFILGFPLMIGFLGNYATNYQSTLVSIFAVCVFLITWMLMWEIGKQRWHFQEIFDSADFTYHPSTFEHTDDIRVFKIEEKIAEARLMGDISCVTECRQNLKKIALKGKISNSTRQYIKDNHSYLGIE